MKIEIRVGEVNANSPKIPWDSNSKLDDFELEKKRMYDFLAQNDKCVIINVDMFLLYTLNSALASFLVKDNPKSIDDEAKAKVVELIKKVNNGKTNYKLITDVKVAKELKTQLESL